MIEHQKLKFYILIKKEFNAFLRKNDVIIIAGFQGIDLDGTFTSFRLTQAQLQSLGC